MNCTGSQAHIDLSHRAATEGMVLLKNNGVLPLAKGTKVALFGQASVNYVKGGTGSGDVYCRYIRNVYDGFRGKEAEGKVCVFPHLEEFYRKYVTTEGAKVEAIRAKLTAEFLNYDPSAVHTREIMYQEKERDLYIAEAEIPDDLFQAAAAFADTAIITFNRYSGEGYDRTVKPGDYSFTPRELALVNRVTSAFANCIIVLDVGGVIDLSAFAADHRIGGILMAWQAGMEGGTAIADILCGDVNPSGKLASTFVKAYSDYPCGEQPSDDQLEVPYYEDIYVGYRYFETIPGVKDRVLYPFGFGLSYTNFALTDICWQQQAEGICAAVTVTNTGSVAGKEVVQVYFGAPQGKLGKPAKTLIAFQKTKLLEPGESQRICLSFPITDMASYDDLGKVRKSAYVLEQGDYRFYLGTSVRDVTLADFVYTQTENRVTQQLTPRCVPTKLSKRMLSDGSFESLPENQPDHGFFVHKPLGGNAPAVPVLFDRVGKDISMEDFIAQFTDRELCDFLGGEAATIPHCNTACFAGMQRLGVPAAHTADGPAGLRIKPEWNICTTAFPCGCLLACTWDPDLMEQIGAAGGAEVKENGMQVWLTPAMNIHRYPMCGRNFEYYSEDPLLSGKMGAAKVRGIQSNGVAASVKHFACNNREIHRRSNDSQMSERALREIYLKGFEICIREADPWTVMSSYNMINGIAASQSGDLLEGILRDEWGFGGFVTTDWRNLKDHATEVKAGNDMKMPLGDPDRLEQALADGSLTRADLEICALRILRIYQKL